jgi:hypothetical protein
MNDGPGPESLPEADPHHHALIGLHALSGSLGDVDPEVIPGFRPASPGANLRTLAEAPEDDVPISARVSVLHDLARADFPHYEAYESEYRLLAGSVAQARDGVDTQQLLDDLKQSAGGDVPFAATASGQALPHHEAAFVGQDVCTTRRVHVGGLNATWVFSEFETDAPFDQVAGWVDPHNWPDRGPMMFKRMELVGADKPVSISGLGDDHWHGVFHEEVQLVTRVNTLLHCDYWREGTTVAGMTYELDLSLDGEIDVDRGFLLVVDTGPVRRVKALKIVGFTADVWDRVAQMVCPFWTDWVRGAVQGGSSTVPKRPTHSPGGTRPLPLGDSLAAWMDFFSDSARTYLDLLSDASSRAASGNFSASDWMASGTKGWSQLAKDWARAWTYGLETLDEVAREGLDAGFAPPGSPREDVRGAATAMTSPAATTPAGEGTTIPVRGLGPADQPSCARLVSIEAGGATIGASEISVTVEPLGQGTYGARVQTVNTSAPPGLYVGRLEAPDGTMLAPAQLYLSRATQAGGS